MVSTVQQYRPSAGRRQRIQLEELRDLTGGLNLRDDPYDLAKNETFDCENVDIGGRGGFSLRRGVDEFVDITSIAGGFDTLKILATHTYVTAGGTAHFLACDSEYAVARVNGAAWTLVKAENAGSFGFPKFVEMRNEVYFIHPGAVVNKWDGTTLTALTAPGFNNDLAAPNEGNFLQCATAAVFAESMWVGNITNDPDGAVNRPSRVRWSHPGKPEDWRTNDWIDLDPEDENGPITAMVEFGDRLLVFKERAIYAIHGAPPAAFEVKNLTKELGTLSNGGVAVTEGAVFFADAATGLWKYDGANFDWVGERVYPLIQNGSIKVAGTYPTDKRAEPTVHYFNQKVFYNVTWVDFGTFAEHNAPLVFAPFVGRDGAWTIYRSVHQALAPDVSYALDYPKYMHVRQEADGTERFLGIGWDEDPHEAEVANLFTAEIDTGLDAIAAHLHTRWFDAGTPAMKKRWKRPVVVMKGGINQETLVEAFSDYDATNVSKAFTIDTNVDSETALKSYMLTATDSDMARSTTPHVSIAGTNTLLLGVDVDPDSISTGAAQTLIAEWNTSDGDLGFLFQINATGFPRIITSPDGTIANQIITTSTAALPDANRRTVWVEFDPNDGLNRVTKFYTSNTLTGTKTQLGATVTGATTSLNSSANSPMEVGVFGNSEELFGKFYAAHVEYNAVILAQPNFSDKVAGIESFTDDFGMFWRILFGATIVDDGSIISGEGVWDTSLWDAFLWARELALGGSRSVILRGAPLGSGVARSLRFSNKASAVDWAVHGLTIKYIPRNIRN